MKRSGRASIVIVLMVAVVAAVVVLFLLAGDSPSAVAGRFLGALAKGDEKTLAQLSYMDGRSEQEMEAEWKETYENAKYWRFVWKINDTKEQDANNATVILGWYKNAASPGTYEEKYELPLVKKDGHWKVDVLGISREMYPGLPR
ncbi:MAG: hypothetical protein BGO01_09580 [Armatimonadetes bacterium 55-13]|nr:DUF4878 domain-containing protein [Armatimonadota bacterium]OJU62657.1 MAG: hypothetical protein BGO01_09580 [Armatimonadetes bacterium 55-13]